MDFLQLYYFQTAARSGGITAAAQRLMVSQPALSKMIKGLEDELGVKLFDRTLRTVKLNENGRVMLKYADRILSSAEDAKREIADITAAERGQCRFSMAAATRLLPEIMLGFREKYPEIDLVCNQEEHDADLPSDDFYIYPAIHEENGAATLLREECVLCVPPQHPLADRKSISPAASRLLEKDNFLIIQNSRPTFMLTTQLCRGGGFEPHIALECDSTDTIFALIEAGMGVSVLPYVTWKRNIAEHNVAVLRIDADFCRYILLRVPENRYINNASRIFMKYIVDYFKSISSCQ